MNSRFARMVHVLEHVQRTGSSDLAALAHELGMTEATVRRYLRELHATGMLPAVPPPTPPVVGPAVAPPSVPANDGGSEHPLVLADEEVAALRIGARFLASEGDPVMAAAAQRLLARLARATPEGLGQRLAEVDARYSFPPPEAEAAVRLAIAQAITERRVVALRYRRESDTQFVAREVEPLAQFFTDNHWSFLAFCHLRQDLRTFRHDRARGVRLTDRYFEPRQGLTLERFIQQRKARIRAAFPPTGSG